MAITHDKSTEIIRLTATDDALEGLFAIDFVVAEASAAGVSILEDGNGHVLATLSATAEVLNPERKINRTVNGLKAATIATNVPLAIYLKKA